MIDCSYGPRLDYPCPMPTLGGLAVDEETGEVLGVPGLYAAGRTAGGICSNSYVSGLSFGGLCLLRPPRRPPRRGDTVS